MKENNLTYLLKNTKIGDSFYTDKTDAHVKVIADKIGIKTKTENIIHVEYKNVGAKRGTKVIILTNEGD